MPSFELSQNNVHFWLRKVFLYVWLSDPKKDPIIIKERIDELEEHLTKEEKDRLDPHKGEEEEVNLRGRLKAKSLLGRHKPDKITRKEAMKACLMAYEMLREPFEERLQEIKSDPYCEGANPRRIS